MSSAYEEHQEYQAYQQGGPLMLYLIMKRILDISEASIQALVLQIKVMKLSKMPGEDVDETVIMIRTTIKVPIQCSTDERNFVPDDIEVLVLKVSQTSSLKEFNEIFEREERDARAKADKYGGIAHYPSVQETCQLASNTYKRLFGPGQEYQWVSKPKQGAHVTQTGVTPSAHKCFNCGKVGCTPSTCDQPCDEVKIKRNAEAWRKDHPLKSDTVQKKREGPGGCRRGEYDKDEHGRILMKNKHGALVVDQKVLNLKEAREKVEKDADPPVTKQALLKMTEKL
jgi:hypothetical protein